MALSANTVWEVRPGGADTNGGGFVTGATGTDWSKQDAAQYSVTDGVTAGTTTITSATANFGTDVVGNIIYVQGGTGSVTAGWYQITARNSTTSITVDRSTGLTAGTGVTLKIGGGLLSPGIVAANCSTSGMVVFLYNAGSTVYSITSATVNIAGGTLQPAGSSIWCGYSTNRNLNNSDVAPTIQINVTTATIWSSSSAASIFINLILDGNNQTTSRANLSGGLSMLRCTLKGFTTANFANGGTCVYCVFTANSAGAVQNNACIFCEFYANTATPSSGTGLRFGCISYNNTGASTDGFLAAASGVLINNVAYANGRDNFRGGQATFFLSNIAEAAVGNGFTGNNSLAVMVNNAHYNNGTNVATTSNTNALTTGTIALTASPFVATASNNFALVRNPLLLGTGYGTFPRGTTTAYPDIGAVQHKEPARKIPSIG